MSSSRDRTIRTWNLTTGEKIEVIDWHRDSLTSLAVLHNGEIAVGSKNGVILIYQRNSTIYNLIRTLQSPTFAVTKLIFLPSGELVSGTVDRKILVWNTSSGQIIRSMEGWSGVKCLALLPSGELVSASNGKSISIWNLTTGQIVRELVGHSSVVYR